MGNNILSNLADAVAAQDAVNLRTLQLYAQGLTQKPTARVATTAALPANTYANGSSGVGATLTGSSNGALAAQDGVTLVVNDLLLVKNEATGANNGLYVVTQVGAAAISPYILTRHVDMNLAAQFSGAFVPVDNEGTTNKNSIWLASWVASFVVGTTAVTLTQLNSGSTYTGTNGINVSGSVISPTYGTIANTVAQGNDTRITGALQVAKVITRETPGGTINGSNATFTLANVPVSGTETLFLNGVQQDSGAGNDYTISGSTITALNVPVSGDKMRVNYIST